MEDGENGLDRARLCSALETVDASLGFLLIFVASLALSFWATAVNRREVCLLLAGRGEAAAALPDVRGVRRTAGALVVGSLGFFLGLALRAMAQAEGPAAVRAAWANLWAALLSMAAGMVRLAVLESGAESAAPGPDSDLPG